MLELINLTKKFGSFTAVSKLNLKVKAGDFYGFLGQNGAGKTTTIKMISGIYTATSGKVLINEYDIIKEPIKAKSLIGYIPDQPFIYDKLTGREFLFFSGGLYSIAKNKLRIKIDEIIEKLKIGDWVDKRTEEYSQGMKQRITIASALLHDPKLLLVDEPMMGLDPQSAVIVKNILTEITKGGAAVFMSTHSLNIAEEICSHIGIIKDGSLIFSDTKDALETVKGSDHQDLESLFLHLTK